jgi:metal-responsive CopG/Arc/MetJ family transcriptional regulator
MKIKTSITLSDDLLATIDEMAVEYKNRSEFIELTMRKAIARMIRAKQDARDIILINKHSDEINAEIQDALRYQIDI